MYRAAKVLYCEATALLGDVGRRAAKVKQGVVGRSAAKVSQSTAKVLPRHSGVR